MAETPPLSGHEPPPDFIARSLLGVIKVVQHAKKLRMPLIELLTRKHVEEDAKRTTKINVYHARQNTHSMIKSITDPALFSL